MRNDGEIWLQPRPDAISPILGHLPSKFAAKSIFLGLITTNLRLCCAILACLCYHTDVLIRDCILRHS